MGRSSPSLGSLTAVAICSLPAREVRPHSAVGILRHGFATSIWISPWPLTSSPAPSAIHYERAGGKVSIDRPTSADPLDSRRMSYSSIFAGHVFQISEQYS